MSAPSIPAPIPAPVIADAVAVAKDFLRIAGAGEDAVLARFAASAFAVAEAFTGRAFIARGFEDVRDPTGRWQMLIAEPVSAIIGVAALPIDDAPVALGTDAYAIDIDADGLGWIKVSMPVAADARVAVSYTAGLATSWDALPAPLAQGMIALIAHLFNDRDGGALPPAAVAALWRPFRRMALAAPEHRL